MERYFNPEIMREESEQRQRVSHKLKLCPEEYLPIIEGAIDGAHAKWNSQRRKKRWMPENHPLFSFVCEGRKSVLYFLHFFSGKFLFCG